MPAEVDGLVEYARDLVKRFLPDNIKVDLDRTSAPGGDKDNIAHVDSLPILNDFLIEYDPSHDEEMLKVALTHEVLHIAFRHVGAAITVLRLTEPLIANMLEQALEEDTEALARKLVAA